MKTAISQNLKRLRTVKELTQHELAELAGVSQSEVCKIESNKLSPTLKIIQRLAKALGQRPEVLMSGMGEYRQIHSLDNVRKSKKNKLEDAIGRECPKWAADTEKALVDAGRFEDLLSFTLGLAIGVLLFLLISSLTL